MESVRDQLHTLVNMGIGGVMTGLLFDMYRMVRGVVRPRRLLTDLGDLLFWLVVTLIMFVILVSDNWGQVRVYVFLGWSIGLLLYRAVFSSSIIYLTLGVSKLCGRFVDGLARLRISVSRLIARPLRTTSRAMRARRRRASRRTYTSISSGPSPAKAVTTRRRTEFVLSRWRMSLRRALYRWRK